MVRMATDFFAASNLLDYPVLALALFLVVFFSASWLAIRQDRDELARRALLPLGDDDNGARS